MNQAIKRGARVLVLSLAAALLLACAGCGKQAAQPDEYGLAAEKSKLDGVDIGNDLEIVSTGATRACSSRMAPTRPSPTCSASA